MVYSPAIDQLLKGPWRECEDYAIFYALYEVFDAGD